jgi:hypothetical protein
MTVTLTTTEKTWLERIALLAVIAFVLFEWASTHKELKKTEEAIAATEKTRASEVQQTAVAVKEIQKNVKAARTPVAKIGLVTKLAALPEPITLSSDADSQGAGQDGTAASKSLPDAVVPNVDIQPLLNFSSECSQCKLKLASDETQIKQLEGERDSALRTAKGGSFWQRTRKVAKYVGIGIIIGGVTVAVTKK